jgi:hypothetical protein
MPLVTYKDLCIDAADVAALEGFWARTLGLTGDILADGDSVLKGEDRSQTIWVNLVPEPKTVKHRVHLDVVAASLEPFAGLRQLSKDGEFPWTVFADPEGGEFCVFVTDDPPAYKLKDVVVDAVDPAAIAAWWAEIWGGTLVHDDSGYSYIDDIPGAPVESFDFLPVPEPKTVKNRIHWDVTLNEGVSIDDLVAAGATVVRMQDDEIGWTVMADPEGNEFCAFAPQ